MIILYRDPNGEGLKDTMTGTGSHHKTPRSSELKQNNTLTQIKLDTSEFEEKIAFLEKKVSEQENTITKMKKEMKKNREVRCIKVIEICLTFECSNNFMCHRIMLLCATVELNN